jgi:hypothetical protein
MLLLTSARPPPTWQEVLASPDERVLWAVVAVAGLAAVGGLWLRLRQSRRREAGLAPPESFG